MEGVIETAGKGLVIVGGYINGKMASTSDGEPKKIDEKISIFRVIYCEKLRSGGYLESAEEETVDETRRDTIGCRKR